MALKYYVYAYINKETGLPYYIGKGTGNRINCKHNVSVPKDKSKIIIMENNLSNVGACALERRYIRWYGRKDNGSGILYNRTEGGETGRKNPESSYKKGWETRRKTNKTTWKWKPDHKKFNSNTPESIIKRLETKKKNGTLNSSSPESIAKMLETRLKKKKILLENSNG